MKRFVKLVIICLALYGIFCGGYAMGEIKPSQGLSSTPIKLLQQDPDLLAKARYLGIDVSNLNLVYGNPDAENVNDAVGSFLPPNTITILPNQPQKDTYIILAHEYLHYVWDSNPQIEQGGITNYNKYLSKEPWVTHMLSNYHECDVECRADEAHSYTCTDYPSYRLSQEYNDYCNQLIPNRKALF